MNNADRVSSGGPETRQPKFKRVLGRFDGIALVIGITIGSGIFATPGGIASHFDSFRPIALFWILGGAFTFVGALVYGEMGTRMPGSGGEYAYLEKIYGPYVGFMFGWAQLFMVRTSAGAGLALVAVDYLGRALGYDDISSTGRILGSIGLLILLGIANYRGVKWGAVYQRFSTVVKVGGLLLLVVIGIVVVRSSGQPSLLVPPSPRSAPDYGLFGFGNAAMALMLIVFSYSGFDRLGYAAGEMVNPRKTIPISMVFGIGIIMCCYLSANVLYHMVLGIDGVRATSAVAWDTAFTLMGPAAAVVVSAVVFISVTGSINGTMMTATRAYYSMAKDDLFLEWFNIIHERFRTPSRAIVAHVVWASVLVAVRTGFAEIVSGMAFVVLISYALSTVAMMRMRSLEIGGKDVYRVPFFPVLPVVYLIGIVGLVLLRAWSDPYNSLIDLSFVLAGLPFAIYFCKRKQQSVVRHASSL